MTQEMTKAIEIQMQLTEKRFDEWIKFDLFHFQWWVIIVLFAVDVYVWWKLADKSKLNEIVLFAAITALMILSLDELGEELALWDYPTDIVPLFPPVTAINLACLPFLYALLYQFYMKWKSYIVASAVMAGFSCFIFEPIFVRLGMYQMLKWKSYYGFPLYFLIAIAAKSILSLIKKVQATKQTD